MTNETPQAAIELVRGLIHGRWRASVLDVALRLGIPELLDGEARSVTEVASAVGASEDGTGRLLRLLAAIGLLESSDGQRFRGTEATHLLRAEHPRTQRRDALHTLSSTTRAAWDALEPSVREGVSAFPAATGCTLAEHLRLHPDAAASLHAYRAGVARHNSGALLAGHPFPAQGAAVVLGADNAPALVELLRARPALRGVLVDAPEELERFDASTLDAGVRDRIEAVPGDPRRSVPAVGDVYVLLHVLHDWPDAEAAEILSTVAAAMAPGSALVVLAATRTEVDSHLLPAYLDVTALLTSGARERTVDEHERLLREAGLRLVTTARSAERPGVCVMTARRAG